ncbi:hypothetical protein VNO80_04358 [Phaseolus coccineus]|uniref:Uncharacterized protein n=1 Tax=Phaseolus coccineus TaxID=3886 RepID=A0AAN9NYI5_PHACN
MSEFISFQQKCGYFLFVFQFLFFFHSCSVTPIRGFTSYMTGFCFVSWMFLPSSIIFQLKLHDNSHSVSFLLMFNLSLTVI